MIKNIATTPASMLTNINFFFLAFCFTNLDLELKINKKELF
jgi:hypothetical protein